MSDDRITSGDPLGSGDSGERHESGLPAPPRERPDAPLGGDPIGDVPGSPAPFGYSSPPPPGAGGLPPTTAYAGHGQLVLSGWWRRVGAALIDGLIVGAIAFALMAPLGLGFFAVDSETGTAALIAGVFVGMLVIVVIGFLYAPYLMARTNGKTVGRMATGIRVVRTSGERMTFGWAMLREVAIKALLINAIAGSVTFGLASLLDVLWPLWDEENRALHDFIVQTRTVVD